MRCKAQLFPRYFVGVAAQDEPAEAFEDPRSGDLSAFVAEQPAPVALHDDRGGDALGSAGAGFGDEVGDAPDRFPGVVVHAAAEEVTGAAGARVRTRGWLRGCVG